MVGILTEKPSAAKNFAKALGGMEGSYNGEKYVIVNSRGHLYGYKMPEFQVPSVLSKKYADWDIKNLPWNEKDFSWIREKKAGVEPFIKNIKEKLKGVDEIVIATDVDPTGEGFLLAAEIIEELNLKAIKYSRMFFIDESVKEIQKAFKERKIVLSIQDNSEYKMATYRTRFDLLSMQFTRIAKACGDGKSVLRQGRLKSAMVKITGDGLRDLQNYKKIPYYQNRFRDNNGNVFKSEEEQKFEKEKDVPTIYKESSVIIDSKEIKYCNPPKLLDLAGLSSILAAKGIKAKDVLDVYQKMYDDQVVSYPRTEDKVVSEEQFNELLPFIDKIADVVGVDKKLLTHRVARPTHVKNGGTHGANRPGINIPQNLLELQRYGDIAPQIYEILAKNYLSTLAEDYKYEQQKGHLALYPSFKGVSDVPIDLGYKMIFNNEMDNEKNEIAEDTDSGKGLGNTAKPFIFQGFPKKPPTPTMKWLMKQLEKHDVGTGATRTSIYADVTDSKAKYPLLIENKGKLSMTEYGQLSYQLLPGTHIGDLKITEELQKDMKDIAADKKKMMDCLAKMQLYVTEDLKTMTINGGNIKSTMKYNVVGKCPVCGEDVYFGAFGAYCSKKCGMSLSQIFGKTLSEEEIKALLNKNRVYIKGLKNSKGKLFDVYITPIGIKKFLRKDGSEGFGWDLKMDFSK